MNGPNNLTNVNGVLYFTAFEELNNSGVELWKSDGTSAGTSLVKDIVPGLSSSAPQKLINANGSLIFTVDLPGTGEELWKSNGTEAGTTQLVDLWPGPASSSPSNFAMLGSLFTFTADDGTTGTELFVMAPNQSPVVTVPASAINATEDTSVVLTGVTLSDVDADVADVRATLTVASGLLTLSTGVQAVSPQPTLLAMELFR